jgi:hypothetical protein
LVSSATAATFSPPATGLPSRAGSSRSRRARPVSGVGTARRHANAPHAGVRGTTRTGIKQRPGPALRLRGPPVSRAFGCRAWRTATANGLWQVTRICGLRSAGQIGRPPSCKAHAATSRMQQKAQAPFRQPGPQAGLCASDRGGRFELGGQAPRHAGVDRDARTHRGRDCDLLQVLALGGGRLQPDDLFQRRGVVLHQSLVRK